jgi:hypothetical protein
MATSQHHVEIQHISRIKIMLTTWYTYFKGPYQVYDFLRMLGRDRYLTSIYSFLILHLA